MTTKILLAEHVDAVVSGRLPEYFVIDTSWFLQFYKRHILEDTLPPTLSSAEAEKLTKKIANSVSDYSQVISTPGIISELDRGVDFLKSADVREKFDIESIIQAQQKVSSALRKREEAPEVPTSKEFLTTLSNVLDWPENGKPGENDIELIAYALKNALVREGQTELVSLDRGLVRLADTATRLLGHEHSSIKIADLNALTTTFGRQHRTPVQQNPLNYAHFEKWRPAEEQFIEHGLDVAGLFGYAISIEEEARQARAQAEKSWTLTYHILGHPGAVKKVADLMRGAVNSDPKYQGRPPKITFNNSAKLLQLNSKTLNDDALTDLLNRFLESSTHASWRDLERVESAEIVQADSGSDEYEKTPEELAFEEVDRLTREVDQLKVALAIRDTEYADLEFELEEVKKARAEQASQEGDALLDSGIAQKVQEEFAIVEALKESQAKIGKAIDKGLPARDYEKEEQAVWESLKEEGMAEGVQEGTTEWKAICEKFPKLQAIGYLRLASKARKADAQRVDELVKDYKAADKEIDELWTKSIKNKRYAEKVERGDTREGKERTYLDLLTASLEKGKDIPSSAERIKGVFESLKKRAQEVGIEAEEYNQKAQEYLAGRDGTEQLPEDIVSELENLLRGKYQKPKVRAKKSVKVAPIELLPEQPKKVSEGYKQEAEETKEPEKAEASVRGEKRWPDWAAPVFVAGVIGLSAIIGGVATDWRFTPSKRQNSAPAEPPQLAGQEIWEEAIVKKKYIERSQNAFFTILGQSDDKRRAARNFEYSGNGETIYLVDDNGVRVTGFSLEEAAAQCDGVLDAGCEINFGKERNRFFFFDYGRESGELKVVEKVYTFKIEVNEEVVAKYKGFDRVIIEILGNSGKRWEMDATKSSPIMIDGVNGTTLGYQLVGIKDGERVPLSSRVTRYAKDD